MNVDFPQAFGRLRRDVNHNMSEKLGCGVIMLGAIASMYNTSHSFLGTAVSTTILCVHIGDPTS